MRDFSRILSYDDAHYEAYRRTPRRNRHPIQFQSLQKRTIPNFNLRGGETFGAEFLVIAKKKGLRIGEIKYDPPPRRRNPRVGGTIKANLRIIWALIKSLILYAF